jgi:hypothetical protein
VLRSREGVGERIYEVTVEVRGILKYMVAWVANMQQHVQTR